MNATSYILLAGYCALIASPYLLRRFSRASTNAYGSFAVGARNFGWFRISAGLSATFVGGAAVINVAGLGYTYGWYGLVDGIATSAALLLSAFFVVPKICARRGISLGGYLQVSGRLVNAATGLLSSIVYTLITAAQIVALIRIVQPFFDVPAPVIALVAVLGVAGYVLYGGYSSVTVTDVIQFIVMALCYFALVGSTLLVTPSVGEGPAVAARAMPLDLILLLLAPLLFIPVSQDLHIRINSAVSRRAATTGVVLAGLCYLAFGFISVSVGRALANTGVFLQSPDEAVSTFLAGHFGAFVVIPTIALICVVISSLDSVLFASASSLAYDFWDRITDKRREQDSAHPRIATVVVLGIALLIALHTPRILSLILSALVIYVSVLLPMLVGRFLNKQTGALGKLAFAALSVVAVLEIIGHTLPFRAFLYTAVHVTFVFCLKKEPAK